MSARGSPAAALGYLADTSIFLAAEQQRPVGAPPAGVARISVATLTELGVGVRRARDDKLRRLIWTQDADFDVLVELRPDLVVKRS